MDPRITKRTLLLIAAVASGMTACSNQAPTAEEVPAHFPMSASRENTSYHSSVLKPSLSIEAQESVTALASPANLPAPATEAEVAPTSYAEFMQRGKDRYSAGEFEGAKEDYMNAVSSRPGRLLPHLQLSRVMLSVGEISKAREEVEEAIEIDGSSSLAWNTLGRVELAERDLDAAVVSFRRATEESDSNSYAWNNLGFVLLEQEEYAEAVDALEAATSGASPEKYMWNNLGMAYEHQDEIVLARAAYRQASELGSDRASLNFERLQGVISLQIEPDTFAGENGIESELPTLP